MKDQYLEYIILLEKTLASFYSNIKDKGRMARIRSVLEFMETHSDGHARAIEDTAVKLQRPALNPADIINFQNSLTKETAAILENENDLMIILDKLASTEDSLGDFYKKISASTKELSDHYLQVSEAIQKLAEDEYNHRDILLRDKDRLSTHK